MDFRTCGNPGGKGNVEKNEKKGSTPAVFSHFQPSA